MSWVIVLASGILAFAAAVGVLRPFARSRALSVEWTTDPLEDERATLLRAMTDLDEERAIGELSEDTYRALRKETEARAVVVLRALEARGGGGELSSDLRALRQRGGPATDGEAPGPPDGRARKLTLQLVAGGIVVAVAALVLAGSLRTRSPGEPITGTVLGGLAFFEQRVAQHPNDLAARLDLAQRYLESGDAQAAVQQYVAVLEIDPRNAEAHAQLGFLLYRAGRAEEGLKAVHQALEVDPAYPEALYFEGVILLRGLDRPAEAAAAFRAYLDAAPFGAHRAEVETLLREAEASG